jgi:hypothetical protein
MGLLKAKLVAVDTTAKPKNIAYSTEVDLLAPDSRENRREG